MKEISQSETRVIKRSSISFNPNNIKNHTDEQVRSQRDNIKRVGFLGGVVWNEKTANIIDGHRRVQSLDQINKYNPNDASTDYEIKVEVVSFDEKTEKEQLAFMAIANTKADYNLLATFIDDVDYNAIGISESEYKQILDLKDDDMPMEIEEVVIPKSKKDFEPKHEFVDEEEPIRNNDGKEVSSSDPIPVREDVVEMTEEELTEEEPDKKEITKINKQYTQDLASERTNKLALIGAVRFESEEEKQEFCEFFDIPYEFNITIQAREILDKLATKQ